MGFQSIFRSDLFAGEVGIVTGGGTGIGRCIAHELAALGATVVLSGRNSENLESVQAEIEADGGTAHSIACNVRNEDEVAALIDGCVEKYGKLDFLVNNAGGQFMSPPEAISTKGWNAVIDTNLTGTFFMCRAAYNRWMGKNGGRIVNIVANFWNGMPMMSHTSAARAGVANLTKSLSLSWAPSGVLINSVAPGIIASSGLKTYPPAIIDMLRAMKGEIPAKRLGTESEVSGIVTFLLSPAANYITGETVRVDGGASRYRQMVPIPNHENSTAFDAFHRKADLPDDL